MSDRCGVDTEGDLDRPEHPARALVAEAGSSPAAALRAQKPWPRNSWAAFTYRATLARPEALALATECLIVALSRSTVAFSQAWLPALTTAPSASTQSLAFEPNRR